jgi:hypothetical protein
MSDFDFDRPDAYLGGAGKTVSCDYCGGPTRSKSGFCRKCAKDIAKHSRTEDDEEVADFITGYDPDFDREKNVRDEVRDAMRRALGEE